MFKISEIIVGATVHHRRPSVVLSVQVNVNAKDIQTVNLRGQESANVLMSETEEIGFKNEIANVSVLLSGIDTAFRNATAKKTD